MQPGETEIEMVRRHIREGAICVARQHEVVALLRAQGKSTELAEELLGQFEQIMVLHEEHLARIGG